ETPPDCYTLSLHDALPISRYLSGTEIGKGVAGDHLPQPLDELPAPQRVRLRQNQRELITAVAGHEVRRADFALHHRADLGEHAVPSRLAQPLVDVPQPVDIDDHDREAQGVRSEEHTSELQ